MGTEAGGGKPPGAAAGTLAAGALTSTTTLGASGTSAAVAAAASARGATRQGVGRFRRSSPFPFASCSSHLAFHPMVSTLVAPAPYVVNLPETSKKSPTTTGCPTHEQGIYGACNESSDPSALPSQCKSPTPSVTTDTRADPQCGNPAFGRADRAILPGRD